MKKKFLQQKIRIFLWLSLAIILSLGSTSCGVGASPPAPIPSPVSSLMSVSNPDASGNVIVTGGPGAVEPGATVSAGNISVNASSWTDFIIPSAHAQSSVLQAMTIANSDGSFQITLQAQVGQIIRVVQIVGTEISPPIDLIVDSNVIALVYPPQGIALNEADNSNAYVTATDGENGLIYSLNLASSSPLLSLPEPSYQIPGLSGIGQISINSITNKAVVVATDQGLVQSVALDSGAVSANLPLSNPLTVRSIPGTSLALIGQAGDVSITLIDTININLEFVCGITLDNSPNQHLRTPLLNVVGSGSTSTVMAVSQFTGGTWVVSRIPYGCPDPSVVNQVTLPAGVEPAGIVGINSGSQALVTDAANNQVLLVDFSIGSVVRVLQVGDAPEGIALLLSNNHAYVVNQGSNSLTGINLDGFSTETIGSVGIAPTQLAIESNLSLAAVLSSFDQSVVLVKLD